MEFPPTPTLVELATEILREATALQAELDKHSLPHPAFSPSGRRNYHDILFNPPALAARAKLLDASLTLHRLALGPADTLRTITNVDRTAVNVLRTLHELAIPTAVPLASSISIPDLAAKVSAHPVPLRRLLRFAYTMHLFQEPPNQPDHVAHTPLSAEIPAYGPYLWLQLGQLTQLESASHHFAWAVRNWPACPLSKADPKGRDMWTILHEDDPEERGMARFADAMKAAMVGMHGESNRHFVVSFDWAALGEGVVVDVGGGNGHNIVPVAQEFPGLRFVVQELEKNRGPFGELMRRVGLGEERVKFERHDFFGEQPGAVGFEGEVRAYVLSRVLHDWSDEKCVEIVRRLVPGMKRGARLFVVERVLPSRPREIPGYQEAQLRAMDLLMYASVPGGCERSMDDWETLFREVDPGLEIRSVKALPGSEMSAIEVSF
ncbi:S-adenosyl-L-methionine-dependent methyltransferase [Podospora aff. communis PSN243]|uniref:S-adenosyl-L-methionine-dependent methyltransferase n=1 Tax=Podospora aff. communis PSN243 TaxID=3040156 RepID=A0AAV9GR57_9PEZI|nr:S-adenosyl-L-methionine-dependent methyltransferase [Podospora aff. communis PSN243]